MKAVVIAGTHSGCGKTTVTLGIMAALRKKGLVVQPFKTGPDFIDAGLHRLVADRPSRNLDQWMCGQEYVIDCFTRHASDADIAVIEGVMGMYDGDFSTASLARLLNVPLLLVVDAYGMAESAGAVVSGFAKCGDQGKNSALSTQHSALKFAGVVFNRVASESHYKRLKDSVQDVPVLGYLPRELDFEIPHRHLGLTISEEDPISRANIEKLADTVLRFIDIDAIMSTAELPKGKDNYREGAKDARVTRSFRIALAYDKAFSFYYEDNLDLLRKQGAEVIRFSPLLDKAIPLNADAVYIGGGYPELNAEALSRNTPMLTSIRAFAEVGKPLYAECGGMMYLSSGIRDFEGKRFPMAGVFPFETVMTKKPRLGYREIQLTKDCIIGKENEKIRGHEFHYSEIRESGNQGNIYSATDSKGQPVTTNGFRYKNTLASYVHVHFGSNPRLVKHFTDFIKGDRIA
jgi:cobyrinic acid a,c-diamide synthase